ncbi:NAD(+) synthase [Naumannella sp. ID2617S]|nr:NAD(+) synthase [Naumannella sp. ID2617S]
MGHSFVRPGAGGPGCLPRTLSRRGTSGTVSPAASWSGRVRGMTPSSGPEQDLGGAFWSAVEHGFARVAACTVGVRIADPHANVAATLAVLRECDAEGVALAVFGELGLTGYAIDDLLLQDPLLDAVVDAIGELARATTELAPMVVVGAPLRQGSRLYNCAVVLHRGEVLGVVPKAYLPNYREFYEHRHFAPGDDRWGQSIRLGGRTVPFGPDLIFNATDLPGFAVHVEVCEDLWVPLPPSAEAALAGASVLVNLSGSPITVTKADARHLLCRSASARCLAAYVYAAAGVGESTTDLSWDGQTMIYENGTLLAETQRFPEQPQRSVADVDLELLCQERMRQGTFDDNRRTHAERLDRFRRVDFELRPHRGDLGLRREIARYPFVPADESRLAQDCYEAYAIQVSGLEQRLRAIGQPKVVIGVSGGLDSTHALIVAARAMDRMGRPRSDILAYTLPGFATTEHTRNNATRLAEALGVSFETIDITPAAKQMLSDLDHPVARGEKVYDVTFENVQAGLRTDYLFRLANHLGGIVLGTGDLSELALGWCTYGVGDQMSHYTVNSGVPKTLIQHLIRWVISAEVFGDEVGEVLRSILDTEITPELVPTAAGEKPQSTEATIGPYSLQDFTLFHVLRFGMRPSRIAFLAWHAWHDAEAGEWPANIDHDDRSAYDLATIRHWLEVFCQRFFAFSQFKRSALPNGPKVSAGGALSPRGDWRMPSDANATVWLADLARVPVNGSARR